MSLCTNCYDFLNFSIDNVLQDLVFVEMKGDGFDDGGLGAERGGERKTKWEWKKLFWGQKRNAKVKIRGINWTHSRIVLWKT